MFIVFGISLFIQNQNFVDGKSPNFADVFDRLRVPVGEVVLVENLQNFGFIKNT